MKNFPPPVGHLYSGFPSGQKLEYVELPVCGCTNIKSSLLVYHKKFKSDSRVWVYGLSDIDAKYLSEIGYVYHDDSAGTVHDFCGYPSVRWGNKSLWRFTVVRDPISRFLSQVKIPQYKEKSRDLNIASRAVNDFVQNDLFTALFGAKNKARKWAEHVHTIPHHKRLRRNHFKDFDFVGQLEDLWPTVYALRDVTGLPSLMLLGLRDTIYPHRSKFDKKNVVFSEKSIDILLHEFGLAQDYEMINDLSLPITYDYQEWMKKPSERAAYLQYKHIIEK